MATKKMINKRRVRSRPRLTIDLNAVLKRRIKIAAAAQNMTMSGYIVRVLEQVLPVGEPLSKAGHGLVTSPMIERADALRKQQKEPFPEDSADLIRESREQRYSEL